MKGSVKKVCLINPIIFSSQALRTRTFRANVSMSYFPPLGLAYVAGVLEKSGTAVKVIDRNVLMRKFDFDLDAVNLECEAQIKSFGPHYVGVTSTTPTYHDVKENVGPLIKRVDKSIITVLGGPHATALPEYVLGHDPHINIICRGEGELTMRDVASGMPMGDIKGISYRSDEKIIHNPDRPSHPNIDDFYAPARHLLPMESYSEPNPYVMHGLYMRAATIFTSRGCPFDCTFCAGKVALGKMVRYQSNDLVLDEINNLVNNYGVEGIYFADDMFEARKIRLKQICGMIIDTGLHKRIKWIAQVRVNTVDESVLKLMKSAGCVRLEFGFETGSQKVLDILQKKATVAQNYEAARIAKKVNLPFQANIIVGMPGEDDDDFEATKRFMKKIRAHWIGFGEFVPLPGSKLFNDLFRDGRISVEEVEKLNGFNFTNISDKELQDHITEIKKTIVIPTRIRSFILDNFLTVHGYLFVFHFIMNLLKSMISSKQRLKPS